MFKITHFHPDGDETYTVHAEDHDDACQLFLREGILTRIGPAQGNGRVSYFHGETWVPLEEANRLKENIR